MKQSSRLFVVAVVVIFFSFIHHSAFAQGVLLRSVGAVNAGVGGTATAMPLDAIGALQWNPGSISALKKNEISFGLELVEGKSRVSSELHGTPFSGATSGEGGVVPVPSMGLVWSPSPRSPFTFGLGMGAVGGAASLYPHKPLGPPDNPLPGGNPVLSEHGRSATVIVLQVTPTVAAQVTERLSLGIAPIVDLASLNINPMSLGRQIAPTDQSLMTYGTRYVWGAGFQIGALYDFQNNFKAGFMFKSPIWAEKLYFTGTNATHDPVSQTFDLNLPMTLSAGISYDGFHNTIIGMDVRYIDYANTAGLDRGLESGVVKGLDWESIIAINIGAERKINDKLRARIGYCWNENPIPSRSAVLAISAPMITQHAIFCGFTKEVAKGLEMSAAYCHSFQAHLTGPFTAQVPGSTVPGSVTNSLSANAVYANLSKKW